MEKKTDEKPEEAREGGEEISSRPDEGIASVGQRRRSMGDIKRGRPRKNADEVSGVAPEKSTMEWVESGHRLLAYLGPESRKTCYFTVPHIIFEETPESNHHPVAWVREPFGEWLAEKALIKTYESGKPREPEDWMQAYEWFDQLGDRKISPMRRSLGGVK